MTTYTRLTCLVCGRFQGGEPMIRPAPGWMHTGGGYGPMQVCPCCTGTGHHPIGDSGGVPACQDNRSVMRMRTYLAAHDHEADLPLDTRGTIKAHEAALRVYAAETDPRTYAALVPLYGPARAADLMDEEPPL